MGTILITGYSVGPQDSVVQRTFGHVGVVLEVDEDSLEIRAADFTLVTELARRFLAETVVGQSFRDGPQEVVRAVEERFHGPSREAITAAIRNAYKRIPRHSHQGMEKESSPG